jgi:hypothetical protein
MVWKRTTSPVAKKFKSQPSAGKIMLTLFWDMKGAILVNFVSKGQDLAPRDFHMFGPMKKLSEEEDFHPMKKSLARCKIG